MKSYYKLVFTISLSFFFFWGGGGGEEYRKLFALDDCLAQFLSKYVLKEEQHQAVLGLRGKKDVHRRTGRGGEGAAAPPPNFGQLRFFGQQEKIWAKPFFKNVSVFFLIIQLLSLETLTVVA